MNANRFFSIPFDNRNDITMRRMKLTMGGIAAYGRWVSLLGMLYDADGVLDMSDEATRVIVADELELTDVDQYFLDIGKLGLIDATAYHAQNLVINKGVCDELAYREGKKSAGIKSGEARRTKARTEKRTES